MRRRSEDTPSGRSAGDLVATKLLRIARKARSEPELRFTSVYHLLTPDMLRECFERLRGDAASGIDQVTKEAYARDLQANLVDLADRLQRMGYVPQPVRRVYIPKPGGSKLRPLGIPCLEDKIVQAGLVRILNAVFEHDFIDDSYGFRLGRGCHDALRALSRTVENGPVSYIVEADIKRFFDTVDHDWLMKFLGHRIGDTRVLRMVKRFLKSGVVEEGKHVDTDEGTPQGGIVSPVLANVYLHYALDLWFERRVRRRCLGFARLIRYADDFVVCFQHKTDAERFYAALSERLGKFNLAVEPSKTQILEFGRFAAGAARQRGERRPKTFDFLGFTHYCSVTRDGKRFRMKRRTSQKKFRAKVRAFKEWLKASRTLSTLELWMRVGAKLQGHFAYYGVTDNFNGMGRFLYVVTQLLWKWMNRRGKRGCLSWEKFQRMLAKHPLPRPRIMVSMF